MHADQTHREIFHAKCWLLCDVKTIQSCERTKRVMMVFIYPYYHEEWKYFNMYYFLSVPSETFPGDWQVTSQVRQRYKINRDRCRFRDILRNRWYGPLELLNTHFSLSADNFWQLGLLLINFTDLCHSQSKLFIQKFADFVNSGMKLTPTKCAIYRQCFLGCFSATLAVSSLDRLVFLP